MEDWFPKLSHVATSSIGASIGEYIAEYTVTPQQLSRCVARQWALCLWPFACLTARFLHHRAFLSSYGMKKDSLGARVVESKHTGALAAAQGLLVHALSHSRAASLRRPLALRV